MKELKPVQIVLTVVGLIVAISAVCIAVINIGSKEYDESSNSAEAKQLKSEMLDYLNGIDKNFFAIVTDSFVSASLLDENEIDIDGVKYEENDCWIIGCDSEYIYLNSHSKNAGEWRYDYVKMAYNSDELIHVDTVAHNVSREFICNNRIYYTYSERGQGNYGFIDITTGKKSDIASSEYEAALKYVDGYDRYSFSASQTEIKITDRQSEKSNTVTYDMVKNTELGKCLENRAEYFSFCDMFERGEKLYIVARYDFEDAGSFLPYYDAVYFLFEYDFSNASLSYYSSTYYTGVGPESYFI